MENSVKTIKITATPASSSAKVAATLNKASVDLLNVGLSVGENSITILVTSSDATATKTYTVKITRSLSSSKDDASLAGLSISGLELSPSFDAATYWYSASASSSIASATVTAAANSSVSTLSATKDGAAYTLGKEAALSAGTNAFVVTVAAADGKTAKAYTLTVTKEGGVSLAVTVSLASFGTLSFTGQGSTLAAGESWTIKPSFDKASEYAWYLDTVKVSTDSSYTISASSLSPGYHRIGLSTTVDGLVYFDSFAFESK